MATKKPLCLYGGAIKELQSGDSLPGGGLTIGDAVTGGGANRVLYEDGSQNLAASSRLIFNGQTLTVQSENSSQTANIFTVNRYDGVAGLNVDDDTSVTIGGDYDYSSAKHAAQHIIKYAGGAFSGKGLKLHDLAMGSIIRLHAYGGDLYVTDDTGGTRAFMGDLGSSAGYFIRGNGATWNMLNAGLGVGANSLGAARLEVTSTTEQLRVAYDASNYFKATVASNGAVTLDAVGSGAKFTFSDDVEVPDEAYGAGWNGSTEVPTKNALYDKIETISGGGVSDGDKGDVVVSGSGTVWDVESADMNFDQFALKQETSGFKLKLNVEADNFTADRILEIVTPDANHRVTINATTTLNGTPPTLAEAMTRSFLGC